MEGVSLSHKEFLKHLLEEGNNDYMIPPKLERQPPFWFKVQEDGKVIDILEQNTSGASSSNSTNVFITPSLKRTSEEKETPIRNSAVGIRDARRKMAIAPM